MHRKFFVVIVSCFDFFLARVSFWYKRPEVLDFHVDAWACFSHAHANGGFRRLIFLEICLMYMHEPCMPCFACFDWFVYRARGMRKHDHACMLACIVRACMRLHAYMPKCLHACMGPACLHAAFMITYLHAYMRASLCA